MLSPFLTASPTDFSSLNTFPAAPASILTLPAPAAAAGFAAGAAAGAAARQRGGPLEAQRKASVRHAVPTVFAGGTRLCGDSRGAALGRGYAAHISGRIIDLFKPKNPCYTFLVPHTLVWGDRMKKWVEIMMPVMLFATVLYFCVFAVTAETCRQNNFEPDIIAETFTIAGLTDAIQRYYKE